ncbi:MAG TPA: aldo/keto reductase [Actinophytocola sp.]|jgi:aryl-alcohol dehydrogenase-like predicted oxidoreductase|uniref:aldo/keto reductase n=1 Tax=Actinophytocola sp. TaxID=1872138 RepID=UPI002DFD2C24|nr:aldo/keto reductase [Actinophytocola sp.]
MRTRQLGRSGIEVSPVGFGCWPIGGLIIQDGRSVGWGDVDDGESIRAIHLAIDLGVSLFDTGDVYGRSEEILGRAFAGCRDQVVIATKFGRTYDRERHTITGVDLSRAHLRRALEGSLRRLRTDVVDLYQLHVGDCPQPAALELRDELETLVQQGKIRAYGWSTDDPGNIGLFAEGPHCAAAQIHLNVLEGNRQLVSLCAANNLATLLRGPLAMGLLSGKYTAATRLSQQDVRGAGHDWIENRFPDGRPDPTLLTTFTAIRDILTSNGRTPAQGALAWLWALGENTLPIPGFKGLHQAEENAKAMDFGPLTPQQMAEIGRLLTPAGARSG